MKNCFEMFAVTAVSALLFLLIAGATDTPEAKRVYCEGNLKKILNAVHAYENDHGQLPPVMVTGKRYLFWNNFLEPAGYIKEERDLACPADPRNENTFAARQNPLLPPNVRGAMSYGMNYFLTRGFAAKKGKKPLLSQLGNPSKVYAFGDCKIPWMYPERLWTKDRTAWHEDESINMIFADGHVKNLFQHNMGTKNKEGKFVYSWNYWQWN
ncbi:MAG: hypothetical protein E7051_07005 [Lentisphaerae bacterium]|nr:hypothetical protein [Lentisphaerota bacterium]